MATLIFSAIGTVIGGPLGGAIGALVGRQVDSALIGSSSREGPRLRELSVTTSSYGSPIPRHFGQMRVPGTIIWATDLVEHRDSQGGGKGRPSVTSYSYSVSFAVALSSRPLSGIGRIWADGNLLRGAAGDLKTGGKFRFYSGHGDQAPDPLLSAAESGGYCPAYRGLAYAVFEDLQTGDFGNRIPALTFEVFTADGEISLAQVVDGVVENIDAQVTLAGVAGISCEGPLADILSQIDPVFPLDCDVSGDVMSLRPDGAGPAIWLSDATVTTADDGFGGADGFSRKRLAPPANPPEILRYYDIDRDYQPGLQRAVGRPNSGQPANIELPVALTASAAFDLINATARRTRWALQSISWRTAEIDPRIRPGSLVRVPQQPGLWRVNDWEWRPAGIELGLTRSLASDGAALSGLSSDPGRLAAPADAPVGTTALVVFELPWDGSSSGDAPLVCAAVTSVSPGWNGAALYLDTGDGQLQSLGFSGKTRSVVGTATSVLAKASPHLFDRTHSVTIELLSDDFLLQDASLRQVAMGANRALLGAELIQFVRAIPLGARIWRLEGLLRGRGGTENAVSGHAAGEPFALLDANPMLLDGSVIGQNATATIAAIGVGDNSPVVASITCRGLTQRPLFPVHPSASTMEDGGLLLAWTRRARGAWGWLDGVDTPLHEQTELYEVIVGTAAAPAAMWTTSGQTLALSPAQVASLRVSNPGAPVTVRQRGSYAVSDPLLLTHLD